MQTDDLSLGGMTFEACLKGVHIQDGETVSEDYGDPFTVSILKLEIDNTTPSFDAFPSD